MSVRRVFISVAIGLVLAGAWISTVGRPRTTDHSWVRHFNSLPDEAQATPLIIEGKVDSVVKTWKYNQVQFTQFYVLPLAVLKGTTGPTVAVDQTGPVPSSVPNETIVAQTDDPPMKVGQTYIFFLTPSGLGDGAFFPVSGPQGRYLVKGGAVYSLDHVAPAAKGETIPVNGWPILQFESALNATSP